MIPIFYSIDDRYAPVLAASLASLVAHAHDRRGYHVTILTAQLTANNRAKLAATITNPLVSLSFASVSPAWLDQLTDQNNKLRCDYFTFSIYLRLFIPAMFPHYEKALYLDADTIVLADVAALFDTELNQALIGAAPDPFIAGDPTTANYARQAIGVHAHRYVNSGVLVMNLEAMRQANFTTHFLDLLARYHVKSLAPDQDYLNAISQKRMVLLDGKWNRQGDPGVAYLIHYNLFAKPWHYPDAPHSDAFWHYADTTAYHTALHRELAQYRRQEADRQHMQALVSAAQTIPHSLPTFASLSRAGVAVAL